MSASIQQIHLASLGGDGAPMLPAVTLALAASFVSVDRWHDEFGALARSRGDSPGWACLTFLPDAGRLVNRWLADDNSRARPEGVTLLALRAGDDAAHIDWPAVYQRYQAAVHDASEAFGATQDEAGSAALLLDVRRAGVFEAAATMIPGARWCDPATIDVWAATLGTERELVVYCVYGHEVGRVTALRLRAAGLSARYLRGGIDAWQAAGRPIASKGAAA
jgi:superoxide dismutase, Fe-Mn family